MSRSGTPKQTIAAHRADAAGRRLATPDIPNWAWTRNTATRVGVLRILKVFDEIQDLWPCSPSTARRSRLSAIVEAAMARNWEFMGHGFTHATCRRWRMSARTSARPPNVIAKATGKRPRGWLGPGLTETWDTPDLLKEEGYDYVATGCWTTSRSGSGTATKTSACRTHDERVAMMLIQHHRRRKYVRTGPDLAAARPPGIPSPSTDSMSADPRTAIYIMGVAPGT